MARSTIAAAQARVVEHLDAFKQRQQNTMGSTKQQSEKDEKEMLERHKAELKAIQKRQDEMSRLEELMAREEPR